MSNSNSANQHRYLFILGFIFLSFSVVKSQNPDSYRIKFNKDRPEIVEVEAQLVLTDSILKMSNYGPAPDRWSNYISHLELTDRAGNPLPVERVKDHWVIKNFANDTKTNLKYRLQVTHEEISWPGGTDGVAFVRPYGVMLSGRSLFVTNGSLKSNIQIGFDLPAGWKISAPWKTIRKDAQIYEAANLLQMKESLMFAGTHEEVVIPSGDFKLKFVLGGETLQQNKTDYIERATKVLEYYIELMGGNPIPAPGNDLSIAMVMLNQSEQVDGEVIGNHLSMFINPEADMQNQTIGWFMFAHEFFHLWNGKTLRFADTSTDWFKEGLSNYYTIKALNQIGVVNEDITKMVLNNLFYQRYLNDPGFGSLAPAGAATPERKDKHWGLVYGGGLFAGVCMDMEIRNNTNNKVSLDDVMRKLYKDFGGKDKLIDIATLNQYLNKFGKTEFEEFISKYITGTKAAPLEEYLAYAGVNVDTAQGQLTLSHISNKSAQQKMVWEGFLGKNPQ